MQSEKAFISYKPFLLRPEEKNKSFGNYATKMMRYVKKLSEFKSFLLKKRGGII